MKLYEVWGYYLILQNSQNFTTLYRLSYRDITENFYSRFTFITRMASTSLRIRQYRSEHNLLLPSLSYSLTGRQTDGGLKRLNVLHMMNRCWIHCNPGESSSECDSDSLVRRCPCSCLVLVLCCLLAWLSCVKASRHQLSTAWSILIVPVQSTDSRELHTAGATLLL